MRNFTLEDILRLPAGTRLIFPKATHGLSEAELRFRVDRAARRVRNSSLRYGLSLVRALVFYGVASSDWMIRDEIGEALGVTSDQIVAEQKLMDREARLGINHAAPDDLVDYGSINEDYPDGH